MTAESSFSRLIDAIVDGDPDTVRAAYHPDARIWHNFDQIEQTVDENVATLKWFIRAMPERRYEEVTRHPIDGGLVQRHVVRGTAANGAEVELPACLFVQVDQDGLITRIDEYVDSAQAAVLSRA